MTTWQWALTALLGATVASCDDGASPGGPVRIEVQSGGDVSDTISAGDFELVVRATEGRDPLADEPIVFASVGAARVDLGQGAVQPERPVETTTGPDGVARVLVRFADQAGPAVVRVTLPGRDFSIDVDYSVHAGSPVAASILPEDTALEVGSAFEVRAAPVDRGGNPTAGSVLVESLTPGVVTITGGRAAQGIAIGRARLVARFGEVAMDTAYVSVVPEHKLVAVAPQPGGRDALLVFDLDGGARVLVELLPATSDGAVHPDWNPVNGRVAYEVPHGTGRALHAVDFSAARGPLIDPATFSFASWPQYSADGEWVFFSGRDAGEQPARVWRARQDGGVPVPVSAQTAADATAPSPDPLGERVAFAADDSIRILELASGDAVAIAAGSMPRWSLDGTRIAYHDGGSIWLIQPNGSGRRRLTPAGVRWDAESLDWSPDSEWIIAHSLEDDALHVVDAANGLALPLAYTRGWSQPAFAPPHIGP